jgi:hypothetical protein
MALTDSYATKAQLKTRLNITDTNDDAALDSALAASSRDIEGAMGRNFNDAGVASARVYYPDDLASISVDDFSTISGLIVACDFSNGTNYSSIIAAANYQLEPLNGVVDGTPGWPFYRIRAIQTWYPLWLTTIGYPRASVQITAQWGWAAVPSPVSEACLMLAEETFKMKDAPYGVAGFSQYGAVRVRENPKVMALLSRYDKSPIKIA